jgi:modulator of FtsH protease HflK
MRGRVVIALVLLAAGWTFWTCLTQIEAGERGVVSRFGKVEGVAGPGLHVGLPWRIERVRRVRIDREREVTIGFEVPDAEDLETSTPPGQILTGDHNLVNLQATIRFAVVDEQVTKFVLYGDRADALVARAAESLVAEWAAGRKVDEVLLRGKEILPHWLPAKLEVLLAAYDLGVRIQMVSISKELSAPRQVKDAFEGVMRAKAEIDTKANQAQQEAEARWTEAMNYKKTLETRVKVYAETQRTLARTDAEAFLARQRLVRQALSEKPGYLAAVWWDEVSRIYARMFEAGRLDLLDNRMAGGGIDILEQPLMPKKK